MRKEAIATNGDFVRRQATAAAGAFFFSIFCEEFQSALGRQVCTDKREKRPRSRPQGSKDLVLRCDRCRVVERAFLTADHHEQDQECDQDHHRNTGLFLPAATPARDGVVFRNRKCGADTLRHEQMFASGGQPRQKYGGHFAPVSEALRLHDGKREAWSFGCATPAAVETYNTSPAVRSRWRSPLSTLERRRSNEPIA